MSQKLFGSKEDLYLLSAFQRKNLPKTDNNYIGTQTRIAKKEEA